MTAEDERHLRACITRAEQAAADGGFPFAALLVGPAGAVLAEAVNTVGTTGDCTGHAELNLMRDVSVRLDRAYLGACTVYASAEPCAMCAAAMYWGNVRRVVFGVASETLRAIVGDAHAVPTLAIGCRDVFDRSASPIDVQGPLLEDEARVAQERYWATYALANPR